MFNICGILLLPDNLGGSRLQGRLCVRHVGKTDKLEVQTFSIFQLDFKTIMRTLRVPNGETITWPKSKTEQVKGISEVRC